MEKELTPDMVQGRFREFIILANELGWRAYLVEDYSEDSAKFLHGKTLRNYVLRYEPAFIVRIK